MQKKECRIEASAGRRILHSLFCILHFPRISFAPLLPLRMMAYTRRILFPLWVFLPVCRIVKKGRLLRMVLLRHANMNFRDQVVYLTGRPERCRRDTLDWLAAHGLPEGRVYMRRNDDRRPARRTKLEILNRLARTREIRVLVDDDELVCVDAERAGFTVVRARWTAPSTALKSAQEREGRT